MRDAPACQTPRIALVVSYSDFLSEKTILESGGNMIDITFDFRTDTPLGRDPDALSPTLRRYHKYLWSKPLPNGAMFDLSDATPGVYLHHRSQLGELFLSSDALLPAYTGWASLAHIVEQFSETEIEEIRFLGNTIGGRIVFPSNRLAGKMTINGARGFTRQIADRMDLTLECIRRHYLGQHSPLGDTLVRYADFFALFGGLRGYVDFFLLQDLVARDDTTVRFFLPFDDFVSPAVPRDVDSYRAFRQRSIAFAEARNRRIEQWARIAFDARV